MQTAPRSLRTSPGRVARLATLGAALGLGLGCSPSSTSSSKPSVEQAASADDERRAESAAPSEPVQPAPPAYTPRPEDVVTPHEALEFAENLTYFYDALAEIDEGERRVVRVEHLGASMIGADDLPAVLREKFQRRFGDGGAGLVLLARYMPNYLHRWVDLRASGWEHCYLAYHCQKDGRYGLGGTTFWSTGGASTTIKTRKHELGDEVSRFELWYLARPGGGRIELKVDDTEPVVVDTNAEAPEDRYHAIDVERGPHEIRVRAIGHGNARAYGVVLETDGPGVVWDQFSKLGVFTKKVMYWDAEHIAGQMGHRDPDLIALTYGGNDTRRVANGKLDHDGYVEEYSQAVKHLRAGKPEASCLIIGISDRSKSLTFDISGEDMQMIIDAQRQVAKDNGCAFFDTFRAMGGPGSLKAWRRMDPPLASPDQKHLNHRGRVKLGGWIYDALITGYVEHRRAKATPKATPKATGG